MIKMMHKIFFFFLFIFPLQAELPLKKQVTKECVKHHISIYRDMSLIEKVESFSISEGAETLTFPNLPLQLFEESILITTQQDSIKLIESSFEDDGNEKTLKVSAKSGVSGYFPFYLTYATKGLSWEPRYTAEFSENFEKMHLNCWFRIQNETNSSFKTVSLSLIDNESQLLKEQLPEKDKDKSLDTHYYQIDRCLDIPDKKTIFLAWSSQDGIPVTKEFRLNLGGIFLADQTNKEQVPKIELWVNCFNQDKDLPEGPIMIYQKNNHDQNQALIKMRIPYTKKDQMIAFQMPESIFNEKSFSKAPLEVTYEQTEFQRFTGKIIETANRLTLTNISNQSVPIKICLSFPTKEGKILRESIPHQSVDEKENYWMIDIPPKEKIDLRYRVRFEHTQ